MTDNVDVYGGYTWIILSRGLANKKPRYIVWYIHSRSRNVRAIQISIEVILVTDGGSFGHWRKQLKSWWRTPKESSGVSYVTSGDDVLTVFYNII